MGSVNIRLVQSGSPRGVIKGVVTCLMFIETEISHALRERMSVLLM
ncbi:hypothetical protein IPdc08_01215 [archaeon]|nr:hypothetical protein IPdc08_01215 [archaeon]